MSYSNNLRLLATSFVPNLGNTRPPAVERFSAFALFPAGRKILADNGHWGP